MITLKTWLRKYKKDRIVLVKNLFKALLHQTDYLANGKRVLWIGVCHTTRPYYKKLQAQGATVWTIDINPNLTTFGNGAQHKVGNATALQDMYDADFFDLIFCNGVIGWGINSESDQAKCYAAMATVLKPNGLLVVGWNTHKSHDPFVTRLFEPSFVPKDLPGFGQRLIVQGSTYIFDIFTRR